MSRYDNTFRFEFFVGFLVVVLLVTIGVPGVLKFVGNIKLNGALDCASNYKESISKYYVSQLVLDSNFKLDGNYVISNGSLIDGDVNHEVLMGGNVPSWGYLSYENNVLKNGCVMVDGYSIFYVDGKVVYDDKNVCSIIEDSIDVAYGM